MSRISTFLFYYVALLAFELIVMQGVVAADGKGEVQEDRNHGKGIIGAILDINTRIGKELSISMELAVEDFSRHSNQSVVLHIKNSQGKPINAALAARDLIGKNVKAILGLQTWEETSLVAQIGGQNKIPVLTFAESTPRWTVEQWPFLVQASPNKLLQMKAIAAIMQSWEWNQVALVYEDSDPSASETIPYLSDALKEVGSELSYILPLPPFDSSLWTKELDDLKSSRFRVFIVHLPFELAIRFFERIQEMNMMEKDYVWITTDMFTSLVHSVDVSLVSSMQGVIGVKSYFPVNKSQVLEFCKRFRERFRLKYSEEDDHHSGFNALQAYDRTWSVSLAMRECNKPGQELLQNILVTEHDGLAGKARYHLRRALRLGTFQIINVMGRSYREVGFWSDGIGFSRTINTNTSKVASMKDLGQLFWPGDSWSAPKGSSVSTTDKTLIIGVPTRSIFKQYVDVDYDHLKDEPDFRGYAIELFKAAVNKLPFYLRYEFAPFNGTYDDLVEQVGLKKYNAAVGDIAIVAPRFKYVQFTQPYTESGLVMIVPTESKASTKAWLFLKPFTKGMWLLICAITLYNGFVVWLIERKHCTEPRGSVINQIGVVWWLSFTTLFTRQGEEMHSNLSRMTMVVWLFVALVITQTYTANLSSILTVQGLEPTINSVDSLRSRNASVGHFGVAFVKKYLEEVLCFDSRNLNGYTVPDDCAKDLRNKKIAAVFIEKSMAKLFLAKFCNGFTIAGPSFKAGGFGFAFPKGSSLLPHVNKALLKVSESGELRDMENSMITSQNCVKEESLDESSSLNPSSFWILFTFTGGISTISLIIHIVRCKQKLDNGCTPLAHRILWLLTFIVVKRSRKQRTDAINA